ncbi:polysaccharide deacetylase family protein [Oceanobacillus manasiensis]|uniref:polysaccharide deacetylase family protein n=1 Tax=Oceanobacillus manasiensis TaxID=586413 RepID=UPI0005A9D3DC|nr:polysaccharide deacetylase family protein [Oceanobacillus manasiensis]
MRHIIISILLFSVFLLVACSDSQQTSNEVEDDNGEKTEQEEDVSNQEKGTSTDEKDAENDTAEEADQQEETAKDPVYKVDQETSSIVPIDQDSDTNEKVVLLTIDDVPDENAIKMAETLKEHNASAIFFVNGHFIETEEGAEKLKKIHDMGFPIGNHTYSHPDLTTLPEEEQTEEIVSVSDRIEEIIGERPTFFRAPHGRNTEHSKQVVEDEGMTLMNWTYGYDYFEPYMDAEKLKQAMITGEGPEAGVDYSLLKSGANLLMHDREWTSEALGDIIEGLREEGYEMVDPDLIQTKKNEN